MPSSNGNTVRQAMIFAAGLGTRLKPLTLTMPKALVRVGGEPLLWHVIEKLRQAGFERIVINVHHFADQIEAYLQANQNFGLDIRISDERSQLLETGGGIKRARELFDPSSPVLIHNVDILSNIDLTRVYDHAVEMGGTVLVVSQRQTKRYLLFDEQQQLCGWTNIETGELKGPVCQFAEGAANYQLSIINCQLQRLAFSGIHVLSPQLFPLMDEWPDRFPIIDFYLKACAHHPIHGYHPEVLRLLDVGKLDSLELAEQFVSPS